MTNSGKQTGGTRGAQSASCFLGLGTERENKTVDPTSNCDTDDCIIVISGCLYCNKLSLANSART